MSLPYFLMTNLVLTLKSTIINRSGYDIFSINSSETASKVKDIPGLFLYC